FTLARSPQAGVSLLFPSPTPSPRKRESFFFLAPTPSPRKRERDCTWGGACSRADQRYPEALPELPEVEAVRRSLDPYMTRARFEDVLVRRPDLRIPFPRHF